MTHPNTDRRLRDFIRQVEQAQVYLQGVVNYAAKHDVLSLEDIAMAEECLAGAKEVGKEKTWTSIVQPVSSEMIDRRF